MADINQVSLPENYFQITSPLLLAQPEDQYLYAKMFMASLGIALGGESSVVMAGRDMPSTGAPYASHERNQLALANPLMTDVIAAKVDFNGLPGTTVKFNRPKFENTTYTEASREVGLNTSISTNTINAGSEQTSLTLKRFAGPYDQTNSRVAPFGIDRFSAGQGINSLVDMTKKHIIRDFHKFLNAVHVSLLDQASVTVRPQGMVDDNTPTVSTSFGLDFDTLNRAELAADNANLPYFPDGHRILVATSSQLAALKTDSDYLEYAKEYPEYNALFPQYVASVGKLHIFRSNTLTTTANSNSVAIHRAHLIAPGALFAGAGGMPRIAPSSDDNYGEVAKVIWLAYLAFGLADSRFVISVRTTAGV